jgi:hypothetical protein
MPRFAGVPVDDAPVATKPRFGGILVGEGQDAPKNPSPYFGNVITRAKSTERDTGLPAKAGGFNRRLYEAEAEFARMAAEDREPEGGAFNRLAASFGKTFADTGRGIKQAGTDSMFRSAMAADIGLGALGLAGAQKAVRERVAAPLYQSSQRQRQETGERRRLEDGISYGSPAGVIGNIAGNALQALGPGQAAKGTAMAGVINPTTIRGNALVGGLYGAAQPFEGGDEQVLNALAGAGGGAAGAGAAKGAGKVARALARSRVPKVDRKAAQQIIDAAGGRNLNFVETQTPGGVRSFGEGTGDAGVMALERNSRRLSPDQFTPNDTANNMARVNVLQGIAGDASAMDSAIASRNAATNVARGKAYAEGKVNDESIATAKAAQKEAIQKAEKSADRARLFGLSPDPADIPAPIKTEKDALRAELVAMADQYKGRDTVEKTILHVIDQLDRSPDTIRGLDNVRQTIGDLLTGKAGIERSSAKAATSELMEAKALTQAALAKRAPSFPAYLSEFQAKSGDINRMQVGQRLMKLATGKVPDEFGVPQVQPFKFSAANANLDAVAQKATGFNKASADKILRPEDLAGLRAIQDDMSRMYKRASNPAQPGSATMEASQLTKKMALNAASRATPIVGQGVGSALDYLEGKAGEAIKERLGYILANGKVAQKVLATLSDADKKLVRSALLQLSGKVGMFAPNLRNRNDADAEVIGGRSSTPVSEAEIQRLRAEMNSRRARYESTGK